MNYYSLDNYEREIDSNNERMKFLRILWCDVSGIRRCRAIPLSDDAILSGESDANFSARMVLAAMFLPCFGDVGVVRNCYAEDVGLVAVGVPAPLPYSVDYLSVSNLVDISRVWSCQEGEHSVRHPWCPRMFLEKSVARLKERFGLDMEVGFETEFLLLEKDKDSGGFVAVETSVYSQSSGFDRFSDVLREMCAALEAAGQTVLHAHGESANGQFEIITSHGDVLIQADQFLIRKEIIQHVARKHGLYASFLPKYFKDQAGSASHVHFSFVKPCGERDTAKARRCDGNLASDGDLLRDVQLITEMEAFMAGILENICALGLLTVGSPNSTRRMTPGAWAGAYACWGFLNKETPLRLIDAYRHHVEYKAFDGTANPYMGLCGLLCAGMDGLERQLSLPPPVQVDPGSLPEDKYMRLPKSFEESLLSFEENLGCSQHHGMSYQWFQACCGSGSTVELKEFFEDFMAVKMAELEMFQGMSFDEEVSILFDKY